MSYCAKLSSQQPLKNSQKVNKLHIPNSSYLKSFKKSIGAQSTSKNKYQQSQHSQIYDQNSKPSLRIRQKQRQKQRQRQVQKQRSRQKVPMVQKNKNQFQQLQYMMQQTDNSMQELLNSSINQFEKLIIHEQSCESLQEQNYRLKNALSKMKTILKDKLQTALQKQKQQLSKMLQDYIQLITKLLQDKQQLTIKIQDMAEQQNKKIRQVQKQYGLKLKIVSEERDEQIASTKSQIEEFLNIIEQYEQEAKNQQTRFNQMQSKIDELEEEKQGLLERLLGDVKANQTEEHYHEEECSLRIEAQSTKIQTLLELLQKTQHENNGLKAQLHQLRTITRQNSNLNTMNMNIESSNSLMSNQNPNSSMNLNIHLKQLKQSYQRKIQQIQQQHEEEFLEYQKAIRDTIQKKDQCIERLNLIIEGLRDRKAVAH